MCHLRPLDHEAADTYSSYWANFIATGNPNGSALPYWPTAGEAVPVFMEIDDKFVLRNNFYAGTKMAARDDFMREYAISKYGFQKYFR
jgi:carboxylesterase type B